MTYDRMKEIISLLEDAQTSICAGAYTNWYNANTCRSFEEWFRGFDKELSEKLHKMISELDAELNESNTKD